MGRRRGNRRRKGGAKAAAGAGAEAERAQQGEATGPPNVRPAGSLVAIGMYKRLVDSLAASLPPVPALVDEWYLPLDGKELDPAVSEAACNIVSRHYKPTAFPWKPILDACSRELKEEQRSADAFKAVLIQLYAAKCIHVCDGVTFKLQKGQLVPQAPFDAELAISMLKNIQAVAWRAVQGHLIYFSSPVSGLKRCPQAKAAIAVAASRSCLESNFAAPYMPVSAEPDDDRYHDLNPEMNTAETIMVEILSSADSARVLLTMCAQIEARLEGRLPLKIGNIAEAHTKGLVGMFETLPQHTELVNILSETGPGLLADTIVAEHAAANVLSSCSRIARCLERMCMTMTRLGSDLTLIAVQDALPEGPAKAMRKLAEAGKVAGQLREDVNTRLEEWLLLNAAQEHNMRSVQHIYSTVYADPAMQPLQGREPDTEFERRLAEAGPGAKWKDYDGADRPPLGKAFDELQIDEMELPGAREGGASDGALHQDDGDGSGSDCSEDSASMGFSAKMKYFRDRYRPEGQPETCFVAQLRLKPLVGPYVRIRNLADRGPGGEGMHVRAERLRGAIAKVFIMQGLVHNLAQTAVTIYKEYMPTLHSVGAVYKQLMTLMYDRGFKSSLNMWRRSMCTCMYTDMLTPWMLVDHSWYMAYDPAVDAVPEDIEDEEEAAQFEPSIAAAVKDREALDAVPYRVDDSPLLPSLRAMESVTAAVAAQSKPAPPSSPKPLDAETLAVAEGDPAAQARMQDLWGALQAVAPPDVMSACKDILNGQGAGAGLPLQQRLGMLSAALTAHQPLQDKEEGIDTSEEGTRPLPYYCQRDSLAAAKYSGYCLALLSAENSHSAREERMAMRVKALASLWSNLKDCEQVKDVFAASKGDAFNALMQKSRRLPRRIRPDKRQGTGVRSVSEDMEYMMLPGMRGGVSLADQIVNGSEPERASMESIEENVLHLGLDRLLDLHHAMQTDWSCHLSFLRTSLHAFLLGALSTVPVGAGVAARIKRDHDTLQRELETAEVDMSDWAAHANEVLVNLISITGGPSPLGHRKTYLEQFLEACSHVPPGRGIRSVLDAELESLDRLPAPVALALRAPSVVNRRRIALLNHALRATRAHMQLCFARALNDSHTKLLSGYLDACLLLLKLPILLTSRTAGEGSCLDGRAAGYLAVGIHDTKMENNPPSPGDGPLAFMLKGKNMWAPCKVEEFVTARFHHEALRAWWCNAVAEGYANSLAAEMAWAAPTPKGGGKKGKGGGKKGKGGAQPAKAAPAPAPEPAPPTTAYDSSGSSDDESDGSGSESSVEEEEGDSPDAEQGVSSGEQTPPESVASPEPEPDDAQCTPEHSATPAPPDTPDMHSGLSLPQHGTPMEVASRSWMDQLLDEEDEAGDTGTAGGLGALGGGGSAFGVSLGLGSMWDTEGGGGFPGLMRQQTSQEEPVPDVSTSSPQAAQTAELSASSAPALQNTASLHPSSLGQRRMPATHNMLSSSAALLPAAAGTLAATPQAGSLGPGVGMPPPGLGSSELPSQEPVAGGGQVAAGSAWQPQPVPLPPPHQSTFTPSVSGAQQAQPAAAHSLGRSSRFGVPLPPPLPQPTPTAPPSLPAHHRAALSLFTEEQLIVLGNIAQYAPAHCKGFAAAAAIGAAAAVAHKGH